MDCWEFWIDVGGTFTDCLARTPDEGLLTCKVLSSGATKGEFQSIDAERSSFCDPLRQNNPLDFWRGYRLTIPEFPDRVWNITAFDATTGRIYLDRPLPSTLSPLATYEISSDESAPLLCIRWLMELPLDQPIPDITVKLGTTRGTNALLERKGARVAFVTTQGFGDVLSIGNQNRPRLFDLTITKPETLAEQVVEIPERLSAQGEVLTPLDEDQTRAKLAEVYNAGIRSLAICLLHAWRNPAHEQIVERIAREIGFTEISVSSQVAPLIKLVSRGDTTVMDAYLSPILREYVTGIASRLGPGSQLKMMTSAGGLVNADQFVGKDSILSGPAGGVIGFAKVAERAGFTRAIGFDMGGTSTDVSRYDGTFEREYETEKGGIRITAPMLSIETVAAGGGSICQFDGVKLSVGPHSAGSNPGPACYGKGGPLTVTGLNLYLGRLLPDRFPFPLDTAIVGKRLQSLCDEIAQSPLGATYSPIELAEGFLQIANENMVRAIRKVSVSRGFDPAEYVLVTFGGAGGQHACAIAQSLGMREILIHPYAGILSAYGIGLADVRRFREQTVLCELTPNAIEELDATFSVLEQAAREEVLQEGIPVVQIESPIRTLEIRYRGSDATIPVTANREYDFEREFLRLHEQLYGYVHENRALEITVARVEVVGRLTDPLIARKPEQPRQPIPAYNTDATFAGSRTSTDVFLREDLQPGDSLSGPAIVCEAISTIVIEPGFSARVDGDNCLRIAAETSRAKKTIATAADPVLLEIFNHLFASIAEQMGETLQRTSFSTNVKERLDFSCALFSPTGDLVVNAPHIPVHLGAMSETVKCILADNPDLGPGDVFVTNDPYRGGSHLPDVTVITPVHEPTTGELIFLTASRAHHAEIGGIVPGSMPPFSKNLAEEGVLIRNFKLVDRGVSQEADLRKRLLSGPYPTRSVETNLLDLAAQVAANKLGVKLLLDLCGQYSLSVVQSYMQHIQRVATEKMKLALRRHGAGEYRFTDHLDDGSPISVSITIADESAIIDFAGTGPVLSSNLNANRAIVSSAVLYVLRCLIDEDIPLNSGVLEPIELKIPESLLNPPEQATPEQSAAVVGGNVETSQRVVDVLLGALGLAAASQGTMNNFTFGNRNFGYYETICGGAGATSQGPGADAVHTHMTNTRLTDVEVIEHRYPVRVLEFSLRHNSGGSGQHPGGNGIVRKLEFLESLEVSLLTERRGSFAPYGSQGGQDGSVGENWIQRAGEPAQKIDGKVLLQVAPGDVLSIATPGGGGWGNPTGASEEPL